MTLLSDNIVTLRGVEPTDIEHLYKWENNTEIWGVSTTLTPFSRYTLTEFIQAQQEDIYTSKQLRLMVDNSAGECVGMVDIFDFDPYHLRAGVGIFISPENQRMGYAKAAIKLVVDYARRHLLLSQLWCSVAADNAPSIALFDSLDFQRVGLRPAWIRTGVDSFTDEVLYSKSLR